MVEIPCYKNPSIDMELTYLEELKNNNLDIISLLSSQLVKMFKNKKVILTNNHTSAHHLALSALNTKRGDKIICSINSFVHTPETIRYFDSEPIFVDVNQDDFNINLNSLEDTLKKYHSKKLKAMFVNHIAGQPSDLDEIRKLCEKYGVAIINDGGFSLGIKYKGELIGENDMISSFSFSPHRKNPLFSAGFLVINDNNVYDKAKELSNHAISGDAFGYDGNIGYFYDVNDIGLDYSISQIDAVFALNLLNKHQERIHARQEIAKIYDEVISKCEHIKAPINKGEHLYARYIVKIDKNRDTFARNLQKEGIATGLHYVPVHLLSYYKNKYGLKINDFPNALKNYQQILSIPMYPDLTKSQINRICEAIVDIDSKTI